MSRLKTATVYMAGQLENDINENWRARLGPQLSMFNTVWSPMVKPDWVDDLAKDMCAFDKHAVFREKDCKALMSNMISRKLCQSLAGQCTVLIARLNSKFTWGSIDEIEICIRRNIPIFLLFPDGPQGLYGIPAIASDPALIDEYIFYSEESLLEKLRAIDAGIDGLPELDPERWLFLTYPSVKS